MCACVYPVLADRPPIFPAAATAARSSDRPTFDTHALAFKLTSSVYHNALFSSVKELTPPLRRAVQGVLGYLSPNALP